MTTKTERFNNELQPSVEENEKGRQFLSNFGVNDTPFEQRAWFKVVCELTYAYLKQPGKEFTLTVAGRQNLWALTSIVNKNIASISVHDGNDGIKLMQVSAVDFAANDVFAIQEDLIAQIIAELSNGTRKLEYITYEQVTNAKINQSLHKRFSEAASTKIS